jgi:hypothetical protein
MRAFSPAVAFLDKEEFFSTVQPYRKSHKIVTGFSRCATSPDLFGYFSTLGASPVDKLKIVPLSMSPPNVVAP